METQVIRIQEIILAWSDWVAWESIKIDARKPRGIFIPKIAGVYEVKYLDSEIRLTIGKTGNLRHRVQEFSGQRAVSAFRRQTHPTSRRHNPACRPLGCDGVSRCSGGSPAPDVHQRTRRTTQIHAINSINFRNFFKTDCIVILYMVLLSIIGRVQ